MVSKLMSLQFALYFAHSSLSPQSFSIFFFQIFGITALKQLAGLADLNQFGMPPMSAPNTGVPYIWDSITENGQFSYHSDG